jgi:hypothetical protein
VKLRLLGKLDSEEEEEEEEEVTTILRKCQ